MAIEIEELVHKSSGKLESKDPYAPFCKVGTKVRIIKANPRIHIPEYLVGHVGVITKRHAIDNANASRISSASQRKITAEYEDGGWFCHLDMLEVID